MAKNRQFKNLIKLGISPVQGNFDIDHLKEIHRRICDGESDFSPGTFRHPVDSGKDQTKNRQLASVDAQSFVVYSSMNDESMEELETILAKADPKCLRDLGTEDFIKEISEIYSQLDYIHPFEDGNSRTLRVFVRQLAEESGYYLDWSIFNASDVARDKLYIARDNAVRQISYARIQDVGNKQRVTLSSDMLGNNITILDLLNGAIKPERSRAWAQSPENALKKYPELERAYAALQSAKAHFADKLLGDAYAQQKAVSAVNRYIQERLDKGYVDGFHAISKIKFPNKGERKE
jgi:Protein involved in cell division